ncbi:RNA polymerase sigma-54 factor [Candidatus Poribacteria bacterium]|nr:MAG: RNA polymerase sigma-54 factor [Candidatus Poribacteria bacterium]
MYKAQLTQAPQLTQKTSITPRLQQALKVLNMPLQELTQFIAQELEQNPFLELEEEDETALPAEESDPAPEWNEREENPDREDSTIDIDWETAFEDRVSVSERVNSRYSDADELQPDLAHERSLHEHLAEQLALAPPEIIASATELTIGEQILGNLNDDGQLELKLFQIPCEFLPELEKENLSIELHIFIQKNLQSATGDRSVQFSESAAIAVKDTMSASAENRGMPANRAWKINDKENKKVYTILYEYMPCSHRMALNFYQLTLDDIAETVGCDISLVETVLRKIQDNFEPLGIAHRDIREALLIQIRNYESAVSIVSQAYTRLASQSADASTLPLCHLNADGQQVSVICLSQRIIENHFDAFLNQQWDCIAKALKVDITAVDAAVKWIGRLSPHPGRYFSDPTTRSLKKSSITEIITPDVEIQYLNGRYQAISVDNHIPRLHMNPYYVNLMRNHQDTLDAEAKEWIEKRYRDATNLLSSLAQRGSTIARVTESIFEVQTEFLTQGVKSIKPLTLRTIAEKIGIHESTVSRVTSNKYVQTPHGMYPLRFFFSNELATTQGEAVSAKQVKNLIQEMVGAEVPSKPLSDQAISNSLKAKGILLARRTVQKYRDELGIPTSRERSAAHTDSRVN